MKSLEKEVLKILREEQLTVTRITKILRSKHRREKCGRTSISAILCKLEKKGLVSRGKTKYNYTVWRVAK